MSLKHIAMIVGALFVAMGALGFSNIAAPDGMFAGNIHAGPAHNVVHLLTGVIAIACAVAGAPYARGFFCFFGGLYAIAAMLWFAKGDTLLWGFLASNAADAWLHAAIGAVWLILGFSADGSGVIRRPHHQPHHAS